MSTKKYYLIMTQGQGPLYEGPYSEDEVRLYYAELLGNMSLSIGIKDTDGSIIVLDEPLLRELVKIPKELEDEYIEAWMKVNSLGAKILKYAEY